MSANLTEINMIRASQHGDLEAFNALILHFQDFFFRVALRILRDENLACDAVQEACLLLFKKISSFRDGSFRGWSAPLFPMFAMMSCAVRVVILPRPWKYSGRMERRYPLRTGSRMFLQTQRPNLKLVNGKASYTIALEHSPLNTR